MADVFSGWTERYQSEPKGMRDGWLNILGEYPTFPRDLVFPIPGSKAKFQREVNGAQEYLTAVRENAPRSDLWVGWSTTTQYSLPGMDRVYGDIDSADLQDALNRARRYEEWCMADFGVQPACIFSAGKGFHLHMTHDYVDGVGTVYSDAFASLIQGSGATPDFGPLKHRKSYPRVPYSMNLKATGIHGRPMYTVPVDLTWDLKEILQASTEIRITPFKIPHSPVLADMLRPEIEKARKLQEKQGNVPVEVQQGRFEDLVHAAIAFSESVGWRLVNEFGRLDGRRRVLSSLYVPALMHETGGDKDQVMAAAEQFVVLSGGAWPEYRRFIEGTIKECLLKDGSLRSPIGLRRFWFECSNLRVDMNR